MSRLKATAFVAAGAESAPVPGNEGKGVNRRKESQLMPEKV